MGRRTVSVYVDTEVDVEVKEVIDRLDDADLKEHGLRRIGEGTNYDSVIAVFRVVKGFHDDNHELPFTACNEDVCGELKHAEVDAIQEASRDNWGHNA